MGERVLRNGKGGEADWSRIVKSMLCFSHVAVIDCHCTGRVLLKPDDYNRPIDLQLTKKLLRGQL